MKISETHVLKPLVCLADSDPDRIMINFVDELGRDVETRTAKQLIQNGLQLAHYLRESCGLVKGDVALMVYPSSIEFIESTIACLLAGIILAPVTPPNPAHPENDLMRLNSIAKSSNAKVMLTNRSYRLATRLSNFKSLLGIKRNHWPELPWYVTDGIKEIKPENELEAIVNKNDLALLQFTSGSTSIPKGVRITHGNLIHQINFNAKMLMMDNNSRFVMWVPHYHNLGLVSAILSALRGNGILWFMSPLSFLKRPEIWFDTVDRIRGTHIAAPNFAYDLIVRKTSQEMRKKWNLSCLRVAMCAGEPIIPRTVDDFLQAFTDSHFEKNAFCPAYGLAEHTVGITVKGNKRIKVDRHTLVHDKRVYVTPFGDLEFIGCGKPSADIQVRIVSKEGKVCREDEVGEIWAQSESVAAGYIGMTDSSLTSFNKQIEGEAGTFLCTGDLGFLHEGELFISGRQKDLIIIRGRNIHPEDIEESIRAAHEEIRSSAVVAFSVPGVATEELVIIAEIKDAKTLKLDEIILALRQIINQHWHIQTTIALVSPNTLNKTTTGKIQRHACRQAWLDKKIIGIKVSDLQQMIVQENKGAAWHNLTEYLAMLNIEDRLPWLIEKVKELIVSKILSLKSIENIGSEDLLSEIGLDSLSITELLAELEKYIGRKLPSSILVEHPTIRGLSMRILSELGIEYLGSEETKSVESEIMPYRSRVQRLSPNTKIAIVGGGVGGLISALELARIGYRDITLFEANAECGGKVLSVQKEGDVIELGQHIFANSYRIPIELAMELGITIRPVTAEPLQWEEKYGYSEGLARGPVSKWYQLLFKVAKINSNTHYPFPSLFDRHLDAPFSEFLQRHRLGGRPHPGFLFDWNLVGYGFDFEVPTAYVLAYLQGTAVNGTLGYIPEGNQTLWIALAKHLEKTWNVKICRNHAVQAIRSVNNGVQLTTPKGVSNFEEVILALPPNVLTHILSPEDPLQEILNAVAYYPYSVQTFKAEGIRNDAMTFFPENNTQVGRILGLQPSRSQKNGWFVCGQYASSEISNRPKIMDEHQLQDDITETILKMGGRVTAFGPSYLWNNYFPHIRKNPIAMLRKAESLQGTRHLWTTGSWLAFETTEHVARHAKHLIATCFS